MKRKRLPNKYLINRYHAQTQMSSDDHEWLPDINKSRVNSFAEACTLMNAAAAELAAFLLCSEGVCTVSATQRQIMARGSTWDG